MQVPFVNFGPVVSEVKSACHDVLNEFLEHGHFVLGQMTSEFEHSYAAFCGTKYCVGVSNGLDALCLSLKAIGIGQGDEVIVPSNTYIATILAIIHANAKPVLCEPDALTYNIDPQKIQSLITAKTKAIMPVHLYGQACEMESIMRIATEYNLAVIEDNAQAQGATYDGKHCGSFGIINATSFYPTKNIGAFGEAGAITTDHEEIYKKAKIIRNYGSEKRYHNELAGHNWRIDELQAGFLRVKLSYLTQWQNQRLHIASEYHRRLKEIGDIQLPMIAKKASHVYHLFVIQTTKRDALKVFLEEHGIQTLIHYPIPPHQQKAFIGYDFHNLHYPIAEKLAQQMLSLPLYPGMTDDQISYVCDIVKRYYHG